MSAKIHDLDLNELLELTIVEKYEEFTKIENAIQLYINTTIQQLQD